MEELIGFMPVDLQSLRDDNDSFQEIYLKEGGRFVLYHRDELRMALHHYERLMESGVCSLWTPADATRLSPERLVRILARPDEDMPPQTKAAILYLSATAAARRAISTSIAPEALREVREVAWLTAEYISSSRRGFAALLSAMHHDHSIYSHSVNVATYALALGRVTGVTDAEALRSLGLGALLHDVGKVRVPAPILNKPGPLDAGEWAVVRRHPEWGMEAIGPARDLPEAVSAIVVQHHERLDGSGYPRHLIGRQIHPFAGIVALVDAYDAMTCDRPYRTAMTPYQALSILRREVAGGISDSLCRELIRLLGDPARVL